MHDQENCKKQQHVHEITGSTRVLNFMEKPAVPLKSETESMCISLKISPEKKTVISMNSSLRLSSTVQLILCANNVFWCPGSDRGTLFKTVYFRRI